MKKDCYSDGPCRHAEIIEKALLKVSINNEILNKKIDRLKNCVNCKHSRTLEDVLLNNGKNSNCQDCKNLSNWADKI